MKTRIIKYMNSTKHWWKRNPHMNLEIQNLLTSSRVRFGSEREVLTHFGRCFRLENAESEKSSTNTSLLINPLLKKYTSSSIDTVLYINYPQSKCLLSISAKRIPIIVSCRSHVNLSTNGVAKGMGNLTQAPASKLAYLFMN